jgi:hypothetical protein
MSAAAAPILKATSDLAASTPNFLQGLRGLAERGATFADDAWSMSSNAAAASASGTGVGAARAGGSAGGGATSLAGAAGPSLGAIPKHVAGVSDDIANGVAGMADDVGGGAASTAGGAAGQAGQTGASTAGAAAGTAAGQAGSAAADATSRGAGAGIARIVDITGLSDEQVVHAWRALERAVRQTGSTGSAAGSGAAARAAGGANTALDATIDALARLALDGGRNAAGGSRGFAAALRGASGSLLRAPNPGLAAAVAAGGNTVARTGRALTFLSRVGKILRWLARTRRGQFILVSTGGTGIGVGVQAIFNTQTKEALVADVAAAKKLADEAVNSTAQAQYALNMTREHVFQYAVNTTKQHRLVVTLSEAFLRLSLWGKIKFFFKSTILPVLCILIMHAIIIKYARGSA